MDQETLQKYVEHVSIQCFRKPFKHKAYNNTRLRTTGGRYHIKTHNLDFNLKIYEEYGEEVFSGIVKHELCHYHLHLENRGYQHKDREFKQLLNEVGGLRFAPPLKKKQTEQKIWEYQCTRCKQLVFRKRRFNVNKYICRQCSGKLRLNGQLNRNQVGLLLAEKSDFEKLLGRLQTPAQRALKSENIDSVEKLYDLGAKKLLTIYGFGPKSVERVEQFTRRKLN